MQKHKTSKYSAAPKLLLSLVLIAAIATMSIIASGGVFPGNYGGRLHSNFDGFENLQVYVENFDEGEIFVRVALSEFLLFDGIQVTGATTPMVIYGDNTSPVRNYITLGFGGDLSYFMPAFNRDRLSDEAEVTGQQNWAHEHDSVSVDIESGTTDHRATIGWNPTANSGEFTTWSAGQTKTATLRSAGGVIVPDQTHIARMPLRSEMGGIISLAQWELLPEGFNTGNFWVATPDGWFYWANPLPENTATSLLLRTIDVNESAILQRRGDDNVLWSYRIVPDAEFTDADYFEDFLMFNGLSRNSGGGAVLYAAYSVLTN